MKIMNKYLINPLIQTSYTLSSAQQGLYICLCSDPLFFVIGRLCCLLFLLFQSLQLSALLQSMPSPSVKQRTHYIMLYKLKQ